MRKYLLNLCMGLLITLSVALPIQAKVTAGEMTGSKKLPHVNVAIFHKLYGHHDFKYPNDIATLDILHALAGKAQFISLNHSAGLKDGDVLVSSNDVLRESAGDFEDFGVDCQLSVHIKNATVSLAGICEILMMDQDGRQIEHKGIVKPFVMRVGADWQLIYYDAKDGIAVYADENIGME